MIWGGGGGRSPLRTAQNWAAVEATDLSPRRLCSSGPGRHWCPLFFHGGLSLRSFFQFGHEAPAPALELGADPPRPVSSLRPLVVLFLYPQGSPPATAEAADSGDGQGFSHLQVGRHADGHLPHGEFPEGTRHNRPPTPRSPSLPSLPRPGAVGPDEPRSPGLVRLLAGGGEALSLGLPVLRAERRARWTLELTPPCSPSPAGGCAVLCRGVRQLLSGLWALSFCHQDGPAQPAFHAGAVHRLRG